MSEFGTGLVYCLGLFRAESNRIVEYDPETIDDLEELVGEIPEGETVADILADHETRITTLEGGGS